jgi:hypothetical protein
VVDEGTAFHYQSLNLFLCHADSDGMADDEPEPLHRSEQYGNCKSCSTILRVATSPSDRVASGNFTNVRHTSCAVSIYIPHMSARTHTLEHSEMHDQIQPEKNTVHPKATSSRPAGLYVRKAT